MMYNYKNEELNFFENNFNILVVFKNQLDKYYKESDEAHKT